MEGSTNLIVLVDDNEDDLQFILQALQEVLPQYQIQTFTDSRQLIASLAVLRPKPKLFILDWKMPFWDGLELITEIRRATQLIHVPVILVSNTQEPEAQLKMLQNGGNGFYIKPSFFSDWLYLVRQIATDIQLI